jgi:hypothetical protein
MLDVVLTGEDLKLFEEFYQRRLLEAGGARDDGEELDIARDILLAVINDGLTPTAEGGESFVRRGAMDWSDPSAIQATQATSTGSSGRKPKSMAAGPGGKVGAKDMLQGILMLGAGLLAALWFFWSKSDGKPTQITPEAEETRGAAQRVATPIPTLESELLSDIVDAGVKTALVVPRTLEVKGVSFVVQPVQIKSGDWPLPDDDRAVSWVYGSVINYALGMQATPDNKALLSSIKSGDTFILRMSTGPVYRFAFADMVRVSPQSSEIFRQNRPGMTIALLGDEEESTRVVIRGLYLPDSDLGMDFAASAQKAELGEAVVIADTFRLIPLTSHLVNLPGMEMVGYAYLAVDYEVENIGALPLLTSSFVHRVKGTGMTYPSVSVIPAAAGKLPYPPLPETIQPRQVFTTTSVYVIPEAGLGEDMVWSFAPDPSSPDEVEVPLPANNKAASMIEVRVTRADLQDGTLLVNFSIGSMSQDVEVSASDIKIEGGTLSPIGNFFPWRLPAGTSREFSLLFSPDGSHRLVVTLLKQGFELTY